MPALLLIGIPIAVVVLFLGIMRLPDDMPKDMEAESSEPKEKKKSKKK